MDIRSIERIAFSFDEKSPRAYYPRASKRHRAVRPAVQQDVVENQIDDARIIADSILEYCELNVGWIRLMWYGVHPY
jgi:hypothetical protein